MSITTDYLLNREPLNFSLGLPGPSNVTSGIGLNNYTSTNDTVNQTRTFQPTLYLEYLKNYPYLKTLVSILTAPIEEGIDQINGQIKVNTDKENNTFINDSTVIGKNVFGKCDFKAYLKNHLEEMILRGGYLGYIDYRGETILETIDPYNFLMVHNGKDYSWIIPMDQNNTLLNVNQNQNNAFTGSSMRSLGEFYRGDTISNGFPGHKFIKYYYDVETVQKETRKVLNVENGSNSTTESNLRAILGGYPQLLTAQKLSDDEKTKLENILVLYTLHRPKSIFEPYLKSLFILSIKELVFDLMSLLQYLKTDYFTVNVKAGVQRNERINSIAKNIESALNRYNIDLIRTYEDPSGILAAVFDKIINRNQVLPIVDQFSDIQNLNIPDIDQKLAMLYNDIMDTKRRLADEIGVSQESISGNSNRWEAISRNEKMALRMFQIKTTIENFVKSTACNIVFNHMNEHYWLNRHEHMEYPTVFNFSNESIELSSSEENGINGVLKNFNEQYGDSLKYGSIGVMLNPNVFTFQINLSTILDAYAAKTKESIIMENISATSSLLDSVRALITNNSDILKPSETSNYINNILNIADYAYKIIDETKLEELIKNNQNNGGVPEENYIPEEEIPENGI